MIKQLLSNIEETHMMAGDIRALQILFAAISSETEMPLMIL